MLNYALREVLGNGVDQKGSLVAPEKLRFDFSHKTGVSDPELAKIEEISTDYIRRDAQVFSKDVPLATAQQITGVRAVFGETYPDPVRVVAVGVSVEDLLKDVQNPAWAEVSIEFCGGTHVDRTGEIKELVIVEESGIAKGIRRIIAVTGQEAYNVQRVATEFADEISRLERMPNSSKKEQLVKQMQTQLNELSVSALRKTELKNRFAKVSKDLLEHQKATAKAENKKAIDAINEHSAKPENKEKSYMVVKLPISANTKAVTEALKHVSTKVKDKAVYLVAADQDEGKVAHGCFVPEVSSELVASTVYIMDFWLTSPSGVKQTRCIR